jgi:hypothetical protein
VFEKKLPQCIVAGDLLNFVLEIQNGVAKLAQDVGFRDVIVVTESEGVERN